jgi:hypothetical protein
VFVGQGLMLPYYAMGRDARSGTSPPRLRVSQVWAAEQMITRGGNSKREDYAIFPLVFLRWSQFRRSLHRCQNFFSAHFVGVRE